ncbi:hypothetical protein KGQ71_04250 [Patescibacteria group bacterium]|nr:hypothetical protein [Patescibacteria group bacterium]
MKRAGITTILIVIVVLLIVGVGYVVAKKNNWTIGSNSIIKDSGSNISDYSAVFLTNGQVYFGKIYSDSNDQTLDLKDIYYLQVNQQVQPDQKNSSSSSSSQQPNIQLVQLGNELHGPDNRMLINRAQIVFTESLKNDSKVVKAISDYQKSQNK